MDTATHLFLGAFVAGAIIYFFRRPSAPVEPPLFESWMLEQTLANPSVSLGDLLDRYIAQYNISIRATLDEPPSITTARTKLQLMETTVFADPQHCPDPQLHVFLDSLRMVVTTYDTASPELREAMRRHQRK
jgi:hypothetical protein